MKPITKSWLWIGIVLLFAAGCVGSFVYLSPALGGATALLGWLLVLQNPDGGLRPSLDKLLHFLAGAAVAAIVLPHAGVAFACLACCTIAALKELWDNNQGGVTSFADFLWTCAGGVAAAHCWLLAAL